jgi:beta-phosphoglucomutase-like phosphatase (HAD superfamily)
VIEDAINGVIAAKAAGMKCVAVTNTHPHNDLSMADLVIDDLSQLLSIDIQSFFV